MPVGELSRGKYPGPFQYTCPCNNSSSTTFTSDAPVRNLGVTFDPHLSFPNHISNLSRSCFMHVRDLRLIRPMLDIATSIVHLKLDYCNTIQFSFNESFSQLTH